MRLSASFCVFPGLFASFRVFPVFRHPLFQNVWEQISTGVAKVRKEGSFRERKVPFAKGRVWLRKEDFADHILINLDLYIIEMMILMFVNTDSEW